MERSSDRRAGTAPDDILAALRHLGTALDRQGAGALPSSIACHDSEARPPSAQDYRRMLRENALLTDHAGRLACALGACPNCWGAIPDCEDCGGRGKPGAFRPDPEYFARFVQPVIDAMAARATGTRLHPPA